MPDEIVFDGKNIEDLALKMRRAAEVVRVETMKTVAEVGVEIRDAAVVEADKHSTTISRTIELDIGPDAARLQAGSPEVALAVLYEKGNKKGKGRKGGDTFSHPLFGNKDHWYPQKRYPFFAPALKIGRRAITRRMEVAWERGIQAAGLRRS